MSLSTAAAGVGRFLGIHGLSWGYLVWGSAYVIASQELLTFGYYLLAHTVR